MPSQSDGRPVESDAGRAPVLYVTDLSGSLADAAELFDLAFLLRSPDHDLTGICFRPESDADRVLDALSARADAVVLYLRGSEGLRQALQDAPEPVNLVVVGGYALAAQVLAQDRDLFRRQVARLFLVGGHVNDYLSEATPRVPIDPRLRERSPERYAPAGDARIGAEGSAFAALLRSGEGVIWLPRDICLWRYSAPGSLSDGGPAAEFLLRELFWWHLRAGGIETDRYAAAQEPVLLSALPAFLLARSPDPFLWMRLFRAITARVDVDDSGRVIALDTSGDSPNLYMVVAIDGMALSRLLSARLRDRPLVAR